eukprot:419058_1
MSHCLEGTKSKGICVKFDSDKGYGFIACNDGIADIFVHQSEIHAPGYRKLYIGEKVEFDIILTDGRRKAVNVTGPNGSYVGGISNISSPHGTTTSVPFKGFTNDNPDENTEDTKTAESETDASNDCILMSRVRNIFKSKFNVPTEFMDKSNDICYCKQCHSDRGDEEIYLRGKPLKPYEIPIEWSRIGLHVDAGKCKINNVWEDWHVAYHGCSLQAAQSIFKSGLHLLKPGDFAVGGNKLQITEGHINDTFLRHNKYSKKQEHFDPNQIFVSPSIRYAGIYAEPFDIAEQLEAQCVFQLRIRPGSYMIGQETIGASDEGEIIDKNFSNDELEWYTKENVGIVVYGLLIRVVEDEDEESIGYEELSDQPDTDIYTEKNDEYETIHGTETSQGNYEENPNDEQQFEQVKLIGVTDPFVENVLKELGLYMYNLRFVEFGIDQNALLHLEESIIECIMEHENDRVTFLKWLETYKNVKVESHESKSIMTNEMTEQQTGFVEMQSVYLYQWIDCYDSVTNKWYEAQIIEIKPFNNFKVHFKGWMTKWDIWINTHNINEKIRLLHTFSNKLEILNENKLDSFKIGTKCDCLDSVDKWCEAQIIEVNTDKKLTKIQYKGYSSKYDEWINTDSYRITKLHGMTLKIIKSVEKSTKCWLCEYENDLDAEQCEMCDSKLDKK